MLSMMKMKDKQRADHKIEVDCITDDQPYNPYTEIQILSYHTDIVRLLLKINDTRCASAADDCLVIIWDIEMGCRLHVLKGHDRPVTCMCVLQPYLLTGASDKQVFMWEVDSGECFRKMAHFDAPIRCLALLDNELFCAGGEKLCIWDRCGTLLQKYRRTENEDVQHMITIRDHIITAVDKQLLVYSVTELYSGTDVCSVEIQLKKKLPCHRESIRVLIQLNEGCFASASLDGSIVLYTVQSLMQSREFNREEEYQGLDRMYPFSVQHMISVEERYVVAAVGNGFRVFDAISGRCLASKVNAHYSKIQHLQFVHDGAFLATCSEDGSIRLWGSTGGLGTSEDNRTGGDTDGCIVESHGRIIERFLGVRKEDLKQAQLATVPVQPKLLGECLGHSGPVQTCLDYGVDGFVSSGVDGQLITWKDGYYQDEKRNTLIREAFLGLGLEAAVGIV